MAINAEILVKVLTSKAEQAIDKLEGTFDRVAEKAKNISIGSRDQSSFNKVRTEVDKLSKSLERFGSVGAAAGMVAFGETLNVLARDLQQATLHIEKFGQSWDIANGPIQTIGNALRGLTAPVDGLVTAFQSLNATGQATAAGIALATTGLIAFAPQVEQAAKGVFNLGKDARLTLEAVTGLNEGFNLTAEAAKTLEQSISAAGLKKALSEATKEQQNLVAASEDFRTKTIQVLDLEEQLTAELREQERIISGIKSERLGGALQRTGLSDAVTGGTQKLLPAFEERGLQELTTGYAEALRLTQERAAELQTAANVEKALTEETSRGVRYREKSAEAAKNLRDYNGKILNYAEGINTYTYKSAEASQSWNQALKKGAEWQKENRVGSEKLLDLNKQTLSYYNAQLQAQENLADVEKRRIQAQEEQNKLAASAAKRFESLALGVGFPLLFGAGAGSVLGSLAGSFAGKGFGGQIIGGAIGQQIDNLIASVAELGQALSPLDFDINAVTKAAGLSGTSLKAYISALEESGSEVEANRKAQEALAAVVGNEGVAALAKFGESTTQLSNAFDRAMTTMAAGIARIINSIPGFLQLVQNLDRGALLDRALQSQDPAQLANQRELEAARVGTAGVDIAKQQLALQKLISKQREIEAGGNVANADVNRRALDVAKQEYELSKLSGDLTNDAVYAAEQELLTRRNALEIAELYAQKMDDNVRNSKAEILYAEQQAREEALKQERQTAINRLAEEAAKKAREQADKQTLILLKLDAQVRTAKELLDIDKQLNQAKIDGNLQKQAELEYERLIAESEGNKALIAVQAVSSEEKKRQLKLEEYDLETALLKLDEERAQARQKLEKSFNTTLASLELELKLAKAVTREEENALRLAAERAKLKGEGFTDSQINQLLAVSTALQEAQAPLNAYITQTQKWLNDTESMVVSLSQSISSGISGAISSAVTGLVDGTTTVNEALSDMFKSIGDAFVNMAAEIIAQQLVMITLQSILKALGVAGGGGGGAEGIDKNLGDLNSSMTKYNFDFAEGGYVTSPTNATVGEGGSDEYIVPSSKMDGAMQRWNQGMRGDAVVSGAEPTGGYGGAAVAEAPTNITIEGGVLNFNDSQYIRQDQVPSIVKQASAAGEAQALRKLQMSTATRKRLGL